MNKLTRLAGVTALALAPLATAGIGLTATAAMAATPPVVTSVTPDHGLASGGNTVVVTGSALTDPANAIVAPATTQHPASIKFGLASATIVSCAPAPAATCIVRVPPGAGLVDVTVTDDAIISGIVVGDRYTYGASGPGPIVGYAGRVIDDWHSGTGNFNKIDIYPANGTSAQKWLAAAGVATHAGGTITLAVLAPAKCMDVYHSGGANGTRISLFQCNGTGAQLWRVGPHGELVNPESGKCLTDAGFADAGSQLVLGTCKHAANQKWVLP
jgi:hypothetical protein